MSQYAPQSKALRRLRQEQAKIPRPDHIPLHRTLKVWPQSCFDCALKRGWSAEHLLGLETPFKCVHRTDLQDRQHLCAVWNKRIEETGGRC